MTQPPEVHAERTDTQQRGDHIAEACRSIRRDKETK